MDYKQWFKDAGRVAPKITTDKYERMYQAFKARMVDEMKKELNDK